jgi:hypothetical protein
MSNAEAKVNPSIEQITDHIPNLWNRKCVTCHVSTVIWVSWNKWRLLLLHLFVFLRNCKLWRRPFRGIVFFKDSNVHQSYNFLALMQLLFHWSRNSVCTRMNWFVIRIHHLEIKVLVSLSFIGIVSLSQVTVWSLKVMIMLKEISLDCQ